MEIIKKVPNIVFRADDHIDHPFMVKGKVDKEGLPLPGATIPRPLFSSVEEMNEVIISRHNERVRKGDLVYNLGDLYLKTTLEKARAHRMRMNGQFFVIKGNHDEVAERIAKKEGSFSSNDFAMSPDYIAEQMVKERHFVWYRSLEEISLGKPYFDGDHKQLIVLCHYAMRTWRNSHAGAYHLYGHSHGMLPEDHTLSFDVGVDCWDFYPVSIEEVKAKMALKMPAWLAYKESLKGSGRAE